MLSEEGAGEASAEERAFTEEGIDQILSGRTEKRQIGSRAGNSFSIATFAPSEVSQQRPSKVE